LKAPKTFKEINMAKKVSGRTVRRKKSASSPEATTARLETDKDQDTAKHKARLSRSKEWRSLAEELAKDKLYYKNHYYPGNKEFMRDHPRMRFVDRYFPYAKGGPLYVDEPMDKDEIALCEKKRDFMKEHKLRYVIIEPKAEFQSLFEQLEVS
jgi:hypothetical protein